MCSQTQWSYHFKRRKTHINHTEIWQSTPNTFDWIWKLTPLWNTICFTSLIESTDRDDTHDPPSRRNLTVFTKTALIGKRDVSYHDISSCGTKQAQFLASNIHIDSSPSSLFCESREVVTQGSTCDFHIRTIVLCQIFISSHQISGQQTHRNHNEYVISKISEFCLRILKIKCYLWCSCVSFRLRLPVLLHIDIFHAIRNLLQISFRHMW